MARDAVIVSTARTGIGKAYRGAFNTTPSPTLAAHPIRAAVERAKVDPAEVDDVIMGAALQQGVQTTIGRTAALRAGLPVTVAGMSIDRQCASGLMAIATAAKQIIVDRMDVRRRRRRRKHQPGPDRRDAPRPRSRAASHAQRRLHADDPHRRGGRQALRRSAASAATNMRSARSSAPPPRRPPASSTTRSSPVTAKMAVKDKETGEVSMKEVTLDKDEGNRPETTLEGLREARAGARPGNVITAGNASQLSDGASACVLMEAASSPRSAGSSRSAATSAWPSPAPSPTKWASARSSPCPSCSSASASQWTTSACGS